MRTPPNLNDLVVFVEVARTRSFSAASRMLGMPNPTVSRRISAMEARLGVRLFERSTRRVELTSAGQRHFERCADLVDEVRLAEDALRDGSAQLSGHLKLSMPVDMGLNAIGPLLHEFAQCYPAITFELDLSPGHSDLAADKTDVAFRLGVVMPDHLIARPIGAVTQALYAAPAYLAKHGHPAQPEDVSAHQCIMLSVDGGPSVWMLSNGMEFRVVTVSGRFSCNSVEMMKIWAERAEGIVVLPSNFVADSLDAGRLQPVLASWELPRLPLYALTTSRMQPARVKLLIDFIASRLRL